LNVGGLRNIAITLIDAEKGEVKAQASDNACLRQQFRECALCFAEIAPSWASVTMWASSFHPRRLLDDDL
jgi:hypothetical protein